MASKIAIISRTPSGSQLEEMLQEIVDEGRAIIALLRDGSSVDIVTRKSSKKAEIKVITRTPAGDQLEEMLQEIADDGYKIITVIPGTGSQVMIIADASKA